jgi:endoglucanase
LVGGAAGTNGGRGGAFDGGASCAGGCALRVQYQDTTSPPEPMTATVRIRVDVFNVGTKDVPLADLVVRYWFTDAGGSGDKATCYYAQDGCAAVVSTFASVTPPRKGADRYVDIGFSGTGSERLAPGAHTGTISIGVQHVAGGPLYDQTDDYSYGASAPNLVDWPTITAYIAGGLAWGIEP